MNHQYLCHDPLYQSNYDIEIYPPVYVPNIVFYDEEDESELTSDHPWGEA